MVCPQCGGPRRRDLCPYCGVRFQASAPRPDVPRDFAELVSEQEDLLADLQSTLLDDLARALAFGAPPEIIDDLTRQLENVA